MIFELHLNFIEIATSFMVFFLSIILNECKPHFFVLEQFFSIFFANFKCVAEIGMMCIIFKITKKLDLTITRPFLTLDNFDSFS
mmetsp:Transcript_52764/g.138812  ORF Transcript_52764/g.138812 Transcript_52764/m.138812 type:complete len:84 (-) Transcript_52764:6792-7043(-)